MPAERLGESRLTQASVQSELSEQSSQRVGPLVVIPGLLRELRADPAVVLAHAGLDAAALNDVDNRIPYRAMGRLLHQCVAETECPHFTLLAGQRTSLSHLGLPGELVRYSPTLGAAVRTFVVYHHLNSQGMAMFLSEHEGMVSLGSAIYQKGTEFVDQIYDGVIAMTCKVMREICGSRWAPEKVLFARARPADVGPYRHFFQAPCRFDCEQTAMLFPSSLLACPMPEADPERLRSVEKSAKAIGVELKSQLRRALRTLLLAGKLSGDVVAEILSMHHRTLNRRLAAQATSFQKVLDEVRFEAACQLLDATRVPLTEIAASLGYSESSAFSRAFRRWSGQAPSSRRSTEGMEQGR
jgi:AraC-like DNA-binding protein